MNQNLTELNLNELTNIEGGNILEDLLHGIGYGVGIFVGALYNAAHYNPTGHLTGMSGNSFTTN